MVYFPTDLFCVTKQLDFVQSVQEIYRPGRSVVTDHNVFGGDVDDRLDR